jgi:signal-transduction protein with cAMP-binding, CBS, and nucleotidyltransferase domain
MKTIREVLTGKPLIALPGSATVMEAALRMDKARIGAMLIVSDDGGAAGIFTERDLMVRVIVAGKDPHKVTLDEVMTTELFTVTPERHINEVWREMQARHIRHLPVLEDDKVVGMLSLRDLLHEHLDVKRHEVQALTAYIQGEGEGPQASATGS